MKYLTVLVTAFICTGLFAQNFTIPLWSDGVPNAKPTNKTEISDSSNIVRISHVQNPTIAVYLPSKRNATGQAIVICPGGGYRILAYDWEGSDVARLLSAHGIAGIVLKYRLPDDDSNVEPHKTPLMDAQQAMKLVRSNAENWNIASDKIGVMGFSAGGHLASTLGTHFDKDSKPNFMALIYPVISMTDQITHQGSRKNLLG
ncbi:MAG: alpha/beta hydrolase, partial [Marinoscillum sp.]